MKNKSLALPLLVLFAVFLLASGVFAGTVFRSLGSPSKTATLQVPVSSQLAHVAGSNSSWGDLLGWAWSSNIGWISFNSTNANSGGGDHHVSAATSTASPTVAPFRGYAWSSNVGYISFEQADVDNCPVDGSHDIPISVGGLGANLPTNIPGVNNCTPRVDTTTGKVSGWARVLSIKNEVGGSSGGWLHLSGTNHTSNGGGGVTYDPVTKAFSGFAWESSALGWLDFATALPVKLGDPDVAVVLPLSASCTSSASGTVPPGTSVTFQANPSGGTPPYQYKWGSASYSSVSVTSPVSYNVTTDGPILKVKDSTNTQVDPSPACPQVVVAAPATFGLYIGRDSSTTKTSHSVRQGSKFAVKWINTDSAYDACAVSVLDTIVPLDDSDSYWSGVINSDLISSSVTSSSGDSVENLITKFPTFTVPRDTYTFTLTCQHNVSGVLKDVSATLRVIGVSDREE